MLTISPPEIILITLHVMPCRQIRRYKIWHIIKLILTLSLCYIRKKNIIKEMDFKVFKTNVISGNKMVFVIKVR